MSLRASVAAPLVALMATRFPGLPINTDPTMPFDQPAGAPWGILTFQSGAEAFRSIGGATSLAVEPLLAYFDARVPLSMGDGLAEEITDVALDAWRRLKVAEGRWKRFEGGAEGVLDGDYRKMVGALFWRTRRV